MHTPQTQFWLETKNYPTFAGIKRNNRRERVRSLLSFRQMSIETIKAIESLIQPILAGETDYFLVDVRIKPVNNIKVFIDGDQGISIEKCVQVNRALYKQLETSGLVPPDNFSLEVSSPGLDEPLKLHRQYKKNINRTVLVTLNDDTEKLGVLKEVNDERIVLESKVPKKKETIVVEIPVTDIKKTVVQIIF